MSTLKISDELKNLIYELIDTRVTTNNTIKNYINELINTKISSKIKFDRIWTGNLSVGTNLTLTNIKNYDLVLFLVQTGWNRNGYITISKYQFGENKNFEVDLVSGSVIANQINPSSFTSTYTFALNGDGSSKLTEVIGIKLS